MYINLKEIKNEEPQSYVTQPDDIQQHDSAEESQAETDYAWLDDFGWI